MFRPVFFSALHGRQARTSDEKAVCQSVSQSVSLSNAYMHCDKTKERSVQIFIPYKISFSLVFLRKKMVGGGDSFYLKFWVKTGPR